VHSAGARRHAGAERAGVAFLGARLVLRRTQQANATDAPQPSLVARRGRAVAGSVPARRSRPRRGAVAPGGVRVRATIAPGWQAGPGDANRPEVRDARFSTWPRTVTCWPANPHERWRRARAAEAAGKDAILVADARYLAGRKRRSNWDRPRRRRHCRAVEVPNCPSADARGRCSAMARGLRRRGASGAVLGPGGREAAVAVEGG
jgi:hypothetical protein